PPLREGRAERAHLVLAKPAVGDAALVERAGRGGRGVGDELDQPVEADETGIELLPAGVRLLREADPLRVGIGDAEDARTSVTRAVVVVEAELLVHGHLGRTPAQRPRGRAT